MLNKISDLDARIRKIHSNTGLHPICDGIVDPVTYSSSDKKILWILKEVNSPEDDGGWDMREAIRNLKTESGLKKGWDKTFSSIVYVSYGIIYKKNWSEIPYLYDDPSIIDVLNKIAYINVKKVPGGSRTSPTELQLAYVVNRELLWDQIRVINPDIIIFGGTFYLFEIDI